MENSCIQFPLFWTHFGARSMVEIENYKLWKCLLYLRNIQVVMAPFSADKTKKAGAKSKPSSQAVV